MLTAAHNIYDTANKNRPNEVFFSAGYKKGDASRSSRVISAIIHPQYNGSPSHDIAVLFLEFPLGRSGFLNLYSSNEVTVGMNISITGYPVCKDKEEFRYDGHYMYTMIGQIIKCDNELLFYNNQTFCGMSGANVCVEIGDNQNKVCGVHGYGKTRTDGKLDQSDNSGRRLSKEMLEWIINAMDFLGGSCA